MHRYSTHVCYVSLLVILIFIASCTPYVVTQELSEALVPQPSCYIGEIKDGLPPHVDIEKKPSAEDITKFKNYLAEELINDDLFLAVSLGITQGTQYTVSGTIIDYKKGSGFIRFLFGPILGSAKVVTTMELTENSTGEIIFSGNFSRAVTSDFESGDRMFKDIAKDFRKALQKQIKKFE